eukprot:885754-Ditylum_brightwellii.AAC.1
MDQDEEDKDDNNPNKEELLFASETLEEEEDDDDKRDDDNNDGDHPTTTGITISTVMKTSNNPMNARIKNMMLSSCNAGNDVTMNMILSQNDKYLIDA